MNELGSRIAAEVSRIAADFHPKVTREEAAMAGQLAGDIVEAFISMSDERRALASRNRGQLVRSIIFQSLNVQVPSEQPKPKAEPWYTEEWAGEVAGPTVIEREYGIARSTLYKWQRDGHVIALAKGRRKFAFPLRQFVDGRPVPRIKELTERFQSHRDAWVWLCKIHSELGEAPIERLRRGDENSVLAALP